MQPRISVIVPIYQVEKYLETCVDSILAQTLSNLELILVDDGSTDGSGRIADRYAGQHSNIKVIHQKNAGLGPARNSGIAVAEGDYIGFIDSDDWIAPCMYEKLYAAATNNNADIAVSGHTTVTNGTVVRKKKHPMAGKLLTAETEINEMRKCLYGHGTADEYTAAFPTSVCMSLYRRELIQGNAVRFQSIMSEDVLFNLWAYRCAKRIVITDSTDYFYRRDGQISITAAFSDKTVERYIQYLETLYASAQLEDESCLLRVKRNSIDYCRMYVGNVANSALKHCDKVQRIRAFVENEKLQRFWVSYPLRYLPFQQRVFHMLLMRGQYGSALFVFGAKKLLRRMCGEI